MVKGLEEIVEAVGERARWSKKRGNHLLQELDEFVKGKVKVENVINLLPYCVDYHFKLNDVSCRITLENNFVSESFKVIGYCEAKVYD